jgi:hypothetical protein
MVEGLLADGYRISTCRRNKTEVIERLEDSEDFKTRFFWGPYHGPGADGGRRHQRLGS